MSVGRPPCSCIFIDQLDMDAQTMFITAVNLDNLDFGMWP
jgi:hypothetical protein